MAYLTRKFLWGFGLFCILPRLCGLNVVVSVPPYGSIARELMGDRGTVVVAVEAGENHEHFNPSRTRIEGMVSADIYWGVGLGFEERMLKQIRDARKGVNVVYIVPEGIENHGHVHVHEGEESGHSEDPHVWMNPLEVIEQTEAFVKALIELDPAGKEIYEARLGQFRDEATALDEWLEVALAPYRGESFFVYHAAFGVFAERYGVVERSLEVGGKEPSAKALGSLITEGRKAKIRYVYVQPGTPRRSAEVLGQALGAELKELDPLKADWAGNLRGIGETLVAEFQLRQAQ